jgi:polyisoprenoid-binding protein YceI
MKRPALAAAIAGALAATPVVAAESFTLDPSHTFPSFEVTHLGFSIQRGRFDRTTGKVTLDVAAKKGTADITIDTASVDTGLGKLEERLRGEDFFNVARYPTMTFRSSQFTFDGDNVTSVTGDLTLLGVTRPVTLKASYFRCGEHPMARKKACGADLAGTIKRSDYGMKYLVGPVGDDVTLHIQVEALKD